MIEILEVTEEKLSDNELDPCEGGDVHTFIPSTPLLSFCQCQEWQVIEIITPDKINCIDINGCHQIFDRS